MKFSAFGNQVASAAVTCFHLIIDCDASVLIIKLAFRAQVDSLGKMGREWQVRKGRSGRAKPTSFRLVIHYLPIPYTVA